MILLKQSQTAQPLVFLMIDSTDGQAGKTGLSPTVTISKNGATFASPAGAVTEIGNGLYKIAGNATDTNTLGLLMIHATATGANPSDTAYMVVAFDPLDSVRAGLTALPNASAAAAGGLPTVDASNNVHGLQTRAVSDSTTIGTSTLDAASVWSYLTASATTANSIGKRIADNLDGTISGIPASVKDQIIAIQYSDFSSGQFFKQLYDLGAHTDNNTDTILNTVSAMNPTAQSFGPIAQNTTQSLTIRLPVGVTPASFKVSKNSGTPEALAGSATDLGNGLWSVAFASTPADTIGPLVIIALDSGDTEYVAATYSVVGDATEAVKGAVGAVSTGNLTAGSTLKYIADGIDAIAQSISQNGSPGSPVITISQVAAASALAMIAPGFIDTLRGDSISVQITGLGDISDRTSAWVTIKPDGIDDATDANATVQITEAVGLVRLNGAAGTAGNGSMTVDDETAGDITISIAAAASAAIAPGDYRYDIQIKTAGGVQTLTTGTWRVQKDVTRST